MTMKSCQDCQSCVRAADTDTVFKRRVEADVCVRFGHILSRPDASESANERIKLGFAASCTSHGQPRPATVPDFLTAQVSMGDVMTVVKLSTGPARRDDEAPATCTGCQFFVPTPVVKRELGWNMGMCALKGRLIFPERYVAEAANCADGRRGTPRDSTDGVTLLDHYENAASGGSVPLTTPPVSVSERIERHAIDPRLYVTDRPVTPEDDAQCIRAWRKVDDPEGLRPSVFMPIFDGIRLTGSDPRITYGTHKPHLYVDHAGLLYDMAVELVMLRETPMLIGGAGTGKTEMGCWLAYLMDLPFTRLSMRANTEVYDFIGETKLTVDPATGQSITVFAPGRFTRAYVLPGVQLVDEPNVAPGDIWQFLRSAFDNARQMVVDNTVIAQHRWNFMLGAQNPSWDPLYIGTNPISAADIDRLSPVFVDLPPENIEREIIKKHCRDGGYEIDSTTLDKIMMVAADLRRMIAEGSLPLSWGIRPQIKVARKTQFYSLEKSYRRAVVDGMEPEVVDLIMSAVRSVA